MQNLNIVHQDSEPVDLSIPYMAGFLGFREVPVFKALLARAPAPKPQLLLVDGFGVLHPRRCGSASHLGVETGYPTIGVGKQLLATDGLEEWSITKELRAALATEHPDQLRGSFERLSLGGASSPREASAELSPVPTSMLLSGSNRNGSTSMFASGAMPRHTFNWQRVSDGHAASTAPPPQSQDDFAAAAAAAASGNLAADSGPVFDSAQPGPAPVGSLPSANNFPTTGSGSNNELSFARTRSYGDALMPVGDETDEDTGTLRAVGSSGGPPSAGSSRHYTRSGRDGSPVVCLDLISDVDGARLGVAVAGLAGTRKPMYVSAGVHAFWTFDAGTVFTWL